MKKILLLALITAVFVVLSCATPMTPDTGTVATDDPASALEKILKLKVLETIATGQPAS